MAAIHAELAAAKSQHAAMARFAERRDRFMDAIDWQAMTGRDSLWASFEDDRVEEDLAAAALQVEYLETLADRGYLDTLQQVGFEPDAPFNVAPASAPFAAFPLEDDSALAF